MNSFLSNSPLLLLFSLLCAFFKWSVTLLDALWANDLLRACLSCGLPRALLWHTYRPAARPFAVVLLLQRDGECDRYINVIDFKCQTFV